MGNASVKTLPSKSEDHSMEETAWECINLETFILVWLDPNVDTSAENCETQNRLREILTCLITFNRIENCENWLKTCSIDQKIILIVSGAFGEKLVPKIHYLPWIISIYVYCLDVPRNIPWSETYPKVRAVLSNTSILLKKLSRNQINLENIEDFKALQVYSLDVDTASYIWYELLLEILLSSDYLPSIPTSDAFREILRRYSSNDKYGLESIAEFERMYRPDKAVSYLMGDSTLARHLNKILRERQVNMLFPSRFLLMDIHKQLIAHQAGSLDAYRLQPMIKSQMETLLSSSGQIVVYNGFLSGSTNRSRLLSTINKDDQFETVLMHIHAEYRSDVAPFAFLREIDSGVGKEIDQEVLFMCGAIFRLGRLVYQENIWTLQLTLMSDKDIPELFTRKQKLKQTHSFCQIGDLLNHCGENKQALIFYEQLLQELPDQHLLIPRITEQLSISLKSQSSFHFPPNTRYILIDLSTYMTDRTTEMLESLNALTSDMIYVSEDTMTKDVFEQFDRPLKVFTTTSFAKSLNGLPDLIRIFTLEKVHSNIEGFLIQLVDEIIQDYQTEANQYFQIDDIHLAKQLQDKIHSIQKQFTHKTPFKPDLNPIEYSLVFLVINNEDINSIQDNFNEFFVSYQFFSEKDLCHEYIVEHEYSTEIFLLIFSNDPSTIFDQFSNVKYVYCLSPNKKFGERIFSNRRGLEHKLTLDLLEYYDELGDRYELNKQWTFAKEIFLKGEQLSRFLSKHFYSKK